MKPSYENHTTAGSEQDSLGIVSDDGIRQVAKPIHHEPIESAHEFVDRLRPSNEEWTNPLQRWLFRGQAKASWHVVPSAFRFQGQLESRCNDALERVERRATVNQNPINRSSDIKCLRKELFSPAIWYATVRTISDFVHVTDVLGLATPSDATSLLDRTDLGLLCEDTGAGSLGAWIIRNLESVALAQHSGVATPIVDWTRNPLAAACFAIEDNASNATAEADAADWDNRLCVWAIDRSAYKKQFVRPDGCAQEADLEFHRPSSSVNSFLCSQSASFTIDLNCMSHFESNGQFRCHVELFAEYAERATGRCDAVRIFTLPRDQQPRLRDLLLREGVTKAHLMPSYANVAATIRPLSPDICRIIR
jgi:FRG domain